VSEKCAGPESQSEVLMTAFEEQVLNDLATLTSEMKALLGNGQPGRLRQLEQRVDKHESLVQRLTGIWALAAVVLTMLHLGLDYLRSKH
jgi:hypothetical protein